ncbi:MAG: N-acetylmuramic acid 6-phosphate etherase [Aestuariivirga sp.]
MQRETESALASVKGIDTWPSDRVLKALLDGQRRAIASVEAALPAIAKAADEIAARLSSGGRLAYAGAGTSIRLAVQDGSELPATFGFDPAKLVYLIAGGRAAMFDTLAEAEDDIAAARNEVREAALAANDSLIAVAASGTTPYTVEAARAARAAGAFVVAIANNPGTALGTAAHVEIVLESGPEVIQGSTRMGAGTAQKATLNLLSTLINVKLGAIHDGMMVAVQAGNAKLRQRAAGIVARIADVPEKTALAALAEANGNVKAAVLLCLGSTSPAHADSLLNASQGNLRRALERLKHPR